MNRYGQAITWSTPTAPHPFSGVCTRYSYRKATTRQTETNEAGDIDAIIEHSLKAAVQFDAKIRAASTNFLDLSTGAAIVVSGISGGVLLASRAVERWRLGQPKTASITATHYPDMVQASPVLAGTTLDAFTPAQDDLPIVTPGSTIIYGTFGLGHDSGTVHGLTIEQQLTIVEDEPTPDGKLVGAASTSYLRIIQLDILAKSTKPEVGTPLVLTGAPDHAADYKIEECEEVFEDQRGKMYRVGALWVPAFAAA